ncbi:3-(3-hydroxy-phenyl)propionate hydroxylase [Alteribacillus persepolensis]|uniref:3-(3-hydroxy-phenyl)propionate hydroxylase n=1 Tax=Alteribacillus persepolensis TaxID=568899 RepID=A0A1G8A918_9BACI|nr:FAD-dependent monooxygenase [Alteribacillus persepolensis]SDH17367.1 3-(3-hydroxy-phenyl)propionate hydroxylase [Alteribacillus persepolensis]
MAENTKKHSVIVVGAGPVGLTAALTLKEKGISCVVLEADPYGHPRPGSRAIFLHKASLKLLEESSKGLGFTLARNGIVWPIKRTLYKGKEVYKRDYGLTNTEDPHNLPPFTALHQDEIESHIYDACVKAGVRFEWDTPVKECRTHEDGVTIVTESGDEWEADYVIGADGGRSVVRQTTGLKFEGPRTADTFLVVDIKEDENDPLPLERVFHYQHPAMGGRNVMHVPFKGGWRVDLQLLEDDDPEEYKDIEGVKKWLPNVMPEKYKDRITWVSSYRFHQVVANSFTDDNRRVLLAGEAAHLFAPFGARGLNSGVPDAIIAVNGMEKALQAKNESERKEAIDAAAKERRIAAKWNRDGSTTALHHLQGNAPEMNAKREVAASLTSVAPKLGRWLDEGPYGPKFGPPELTTKY